MTAENLNFRLMLKSPIISKIKINIKRVIWKYKLLKYRSAVSLPCIETGLIIRSIQHSRTIHYQIGPIFEYRETERESSIDPDKNVLLSHIIWLSDYIPIGLFSPLYAQTHCKKVYKNRSKAILILHEAKNVQPNEPHQDLSPF